jgi:hypothetical protein
MASMVHRLKALLWDTTLCPGYTVPDVSKERIAGIFKDLEFQEI